MMPVRSDAVLQITNLHLEISTSAGMLRPVRGVDLEVSPGETLCIVGESGCGKSLTAMTVPGLLPRNAHVASGQVVMQGQDLLSLTARQMEDIRGGRIGVIFQDPMSALNPTKTIGRQLTEAYIRHIRRDQKAAREKAIALLHEVGITDAARRLGQYPHELSGGLRQRIMIAMAMMPDPKLIIADEATTALDVTVQAQVLALLRHLQRGRGMALIFITHDLGVVAAIADRVAVLYAGQVVETGPVRDILAAPRHPYTRALISCVPVIDADAIRNRGTRPLGAIPGRIPDMTQTFSGCAFQPRCAVAQAACAIRAPDDHAHGAHRTRCHLARGDLAARGHA